MSGMDHQAVDILIRQIVSALDKKLGDVNCDKTFKSVIYGINPDHTYKIIKAGQFYHVPSALSEQLSVGQNVWVKIPCGFIRNMHICGLATKN